jgi:DNA-binding protein YbaB
MVCRMPSQDRAELDAMLAEYRSFTDRVRRLRTDVAAMTVTARSSDGCVSATVDSLGDLRSLVFDTAIAGRLDLTTLAARVVEAAASAAAQVRQQKADTMSDLMPPLLRQAIRPEVHDLMNAVREWGGRP